jgi:5-methyltetrahydrofolate--homocysteine methyltransferase
MSRPSIIEAAKTRVLVLDGAMGTEFQRRNLKEEDYRHGHFENHPGHLKGCHDALCMTRPDVVIAVHEDYLNAGADIIETNSFTSTSISLADYGLQAYDYEMTLAAARCAREAADRHQSEAKPRYVAGSLGPTNRTASLSPDVNRPGFRAVNFMELKEAYATQARALLDGGVDCLLLETVFDTLNVKAGLFACEEVMEERGLRLPLWVSGTITDASGRTLSGQTVDAFWTSIEHADLFCVGLNCALGAAQLRPYLSELAGLAPCAISAYPNAGLPNEMGEYDQTPQEMSDLVAEYAHAGIVNIIGGCCGSTPEHIRLIAEKVNGAGVRRAA